MSAVKIRKDDKGRWWVRVDHNQKRISKRAKDEQDAQEIAHDIEALIRRKGETAIKDLSRKRKLGRETVKSYAETWKKRLAQSNLKISTVNSYEGILENHLVPYLGDVALEDINRPMLKDFLAEKVESGLSRDSVRLIVATLSVILTEAMDDGVIDANPAHRLGKFYGKAPKKRDRPDPFSLGEVAFILGGLKQKFPEYYEFVLTLHLTGMRPGEAVVLKVSDLDFRQDLIRVERNLPSNPSVKKITTTKSKRPRDVEMDANLKAELRSMLKRRKEEYLGKGRSEIPEWLFCHEATSMKDLKNWQNNFRQRWKRLLVSVQVRHRGPGHMRHTFASLNLSEGKPLLWVSAQLGHRDGDVTLKKYASWMPRTKSRKVSKKKRSKKEE